MTPEAKAFRNAVVQTIRERMRNPLYLLLQHEYGGRETHKHQMMILGSVLLPEVDSEPFYLDDPKVRALIASQLSIHPHDFFHNANIATWGRLSIQDADRTLGRRFYAVNKMSELAWGFTIVFNEAEKAAEDSVIEADVVVLPDFVSVTDTIRYRAIGA